MGFKMNGSPAKMGTISGTAGHGSALKMKAEASAASALKQKEKRETSWWKGEEGLIPDELQPGVNRPKVKTEHGKKVEADKKATESKTSSKKSYVKKGGKSTGNMKDYALNSQARRDEYDARGWAHDKTTKVTAATTATAKPTKTEEAVAKGEVKKGNIAEKAAKRTGEVVENVDKKTSKLARKAAKKTGGKGSVEHLEAKKAHLEAKETDRQGGKGGRKQGFFRKLSSKINKKKQAKTQGKIDKRKTEDNEIKEA